ncbi:MAG: efflux RND transporter periplasmic adaptor subunit [Betaproteobacteria bacterium]|nr:efflux RND transporter periplasmic adaptor subunit [Betaproteobacteria bacterium]
MTSSLGSGPAAVVGAVASEPRVGAAFATSGGAASQADFWSLLVSARTSDQLCEAWLGILCQWTPGTQAGLLLLQDAGDRYAPAAVWPDPDRDMSFLADIAQQALVERRGVVREESSGLAQCAYPLLGADFAYGVVVMHLAARGENGLRDALRLLHWGAGWLVGLFDKRELQESSLRLQRSALLQELLVGALETRADDETARWIVNRLAEALPCRLAMMGRAGTPDGRGLKISSVSGSAGFEPRANLLAVAREAMIEAVAAGRLQACPPLADDDSGGVIEPGALADYAGEAGAGGAIAVPLVHDGRTLGALLLDFERPPDAETHAFVETLALALAPGVDLRRLAGRGLVEHAGTRAHAAMRLLAGPRHPGVKLATVTAAVLLVIAAFVQVDFRVRSPATIEGRIQRAATAPFDGFVAQASARAGDVVHKGDVLARLDDRDLDLQEARSAADAELADRKLREALAKGDAVQVRLAQAEAEQARAELALVRGKLARVTITAPFDGRIVKGDLSQQLGAPVDEGRILFEVAPLDAWRVVLKVDERDIAHLRVGEPGELVLAGLPGMRFDVLVSRISPVAVAEDGRNAFRVEAKVIGGSDRIQPGMEGVGKIVAGERSLLWVVFHRLVDWARYGAWTLGL